MVAAHVRSWCSLSLVDCTNQYKTAEANTGTFGDLCVFSPVVVRQPPRADKWLGTLSLAQNWFGERVLSLWSLLCLRRNNP